MKTRNIANIIIILLILTLIGLNIYERYFNKDGKTEPIDYDSYKTELIKVNMTLSQRLDELTKLVEDSRKYREAPPKVVKEYIREKPVYHITRVVDSIIYVSDTIGKEFGISTNYLLLEPKADKLIGFNLDRNNIQLSLLDIDGNFKEKSWPMDLDHYKYQYLDKKFHYTRDDPEKKMNRSLYNQLYLNLDYNLISGNTETTADWSLILGRLRIRTSAGVELMENPELSAKIGLGYRLLK